MSPFVVVDGYSGFVPGQIEQTLDVVAKVLALEIVKAQEQDAQLEVLLAPPRQISLLSGCWDDG